MTYQTREEWLTAATTHARNHLQNLPSRIRVACGFPSTYKRSSTLAESWPDTSSADGTFEVLISPTVAQPAEVLALLISQLAHALPGALTLASQTYRDAVINAGLAPATPDDWKTLLEGPDFMDLWQVTLEALGPYPHAAIITGQTKTQSTRMLKLCCPSCGYTVRTTAKWLKVGLPICPCGDTLAPEADTTEEV